MSDPSAHPPREASGSEKIAHDPNVVREDPRWHLLHIEAYDLLLKQLEEPFLVQEKLRERIVFYPHQWAVAFKVKNQMLGRGILADEVGLGKTIEAGILIKEYLARGQAQRTLILTPPSLMFQWKGELDSKFDEKFVVAHSDDSDFKGFGKNSKVICSLDTAKRPPTSDQIISQNWDLIIIDEAHRLRNKGTQLYNFVRSIPSRYMLLLTATPFHNNIFELHSLVHVVRPGLLGTQVQFERTYANDTRGRVLNMRRRGELQNLLSKIMVRTTRKETANYLEFQPRVAKNIILNPTPNETRLYDAVSDYIASEYGRTIGGRLAMTGKFVLMTFQREAASSTAAILSALNRRDPRGTDPQVQKLVQMAQQVQDSKLVELCRLLETSTEKVVVYTSFLSTQASILEKLATTGIGTAEFSGSLSVSERRQAIDDFKNKQDIRVLVSSDAGSEGTNLQFCNILVNYDLPWNPMRIEQRIGRLHRIGQRREVMIYNLSLQGTIEEYVMRILYMKINLFQMTIGDLDLILEGLENKIEERIFDTYLESRRKGRLEIENKFSALADELFRRKQMAERVKEFDDKVLQNFDLSPLKQRSS